MAVCPTSEYRVLSPIIADFCVEVKGLADIAKSIFWLGVKRYNPFSEVVIFFLPFSAICTNTSFFHGLRKSDSILRRFSST
jgi:hypothetical protein